MNNKDNKYTIGQKVWFVLQEDEDNPYTLVCPVCHGEGKIEQTSNWVFEGYHFNKIKAECPACEGNTFVDDKYKKREKINLSKVYAGEINEIYYYQYKNSKYETGHYAYGIKYIDIYGETSYAQIDETAVFCLDNKRDCEALCERWNSMEILRAKCHIFGS